MAPIRILVADDHPIVRQGLHNLLNQFDDLVIVGEADTAPAVLEHAATLHPDVLLLDVRLGGWDGIEVARQLRRLQPDVRVIILTTYDDDEYLYGALQAGAQAYLLKDVSLDVLPAAIRAVHGGERLLSPLLVDKVLRQFERLATDRIRRESRLTDEELQILGLMANGATSSEIASQLFWSEVTVRKRVQEILDKLGAANRTQAVAKAIRLGLI